MTTDEPTPSEQDLYLAALAGGGRLSPPDTADPVALAGLLARGLLVRTADGYAAASPRAAGDRLSADLCSEATGLLLRADRLADTLAPLTAAYDAAHRPAPATTGSIRVEGNADIRQRISELISDCGDEMLAAQPGHRPIAGLRMASVQDVALLRRGGAIRTLYQPVALADRTVAEHAALMAGYGSQFRVLHEPYPRMLVFDRAVAVIPDAADAAGAVFVHNAATVAYLVRLFERDWARACPVDRSADAPHPTSARIGRLLARGLTQRAIAARLGLSERTVAGHIARLRELYDAETLFQLGWQMRGARDD
ncbi:helix-turn-helix domain-containing protein [Kitasatospora sp. NPDC057965]|uniref:helix-turn-helix domain-containing protein n=1 Tax=Kitasatospora sp. NPDC057965 TaxID=3346291 RepID=UPI0036D96817